MPLETAYCTGNGLRVEEEFARLDLWHSILLCRFHLCMASPGTTYQADASALVLNIR